MPETTNPLSLIRDLRRRGIVEHFGTRELPGTNSLYYGYAQLVDLSSVTQSHATSTQSSMVAWGIARNLDSARWSVLGELLERYCGSVVNTEQLVTGVFSDFDELALDPAKLTLIDNFGECTHDTIRGTKLSWVAGSVINTAESKLVPAAAVYAPFDCVTEGDYGFPPNTTGFGCGRTYFEAIAHGICEVVERDALATTWFQRNFIAISDSALNNILPSTLKTQNGHHEKVSAIKLTTDTQIPAFMVKIESFIENRPAISLGFRADLDPVSALNHAFEEAMLSSHLMMQLKEHRPALFNQRYHEIPTDPLGRSIFLCQHTNKGVFDSLTHGETSEQIVNVEIPESTRDRCFELIHRVACMGFDVIVVDLTSAVAKKAGMYVVRVLIPGFQLLENSEHQFIEGACSRAPELSSFNFGRPPFPI